MPGGSHEPHRLPDGPCTPDTERLRYNAAMPRARKKGGGKRASGEGSVYPTADGRWRGYVRIDGKKKYVSAQTQAKALARLDELKVNVATGAPLTAKQRVTVAAYAATWLENTARGRLRPRTFDSVETHVRVHINPVMGHLFVDEVRPIHVRRLYRVKQDEGLSTNTIRRIATTMKQIFKEAVVDQVIPHNPTSDVKLPAAGKYLVDPPTTEEINILRDAAEGNRIFEAFIALAITSGLRHGELLALTWDRVKLDDREQGSLSITHTMQRIKGSGLKAVDTKTEASRAVLPLAPAVVEILRSHKKRQAEERLIAGGEWQDHNLIFCRPTGQPRSVESNLRSFYRLQEKAGVRRFRVHDLRHAFVTYLLALGEDLKTIQELARHSSIYVTMNTYAHVRPAAKRGAVDKLGGVIDRSVDIG